MLLGSNLALFVTVSIQKLRDLCLRLNAVWERHECRELFGVYATHNGLEAPGDCRISAWIDRRCQSRGIDVAYQTHS